MERRFPTTGPPRKSGEKNYFKILLINNEYRVFKFYSEGELLTPANLEHTADRGWQVSTHQSEATLWPGLSMVYGSQSDRPECWKVLIS